MTKSYMLNITKNGKDENTFVVDTEDIDALTKKVSERGFNVESVELETLDDEGLLEVLDHGQ